MNFIIAVTDGVNQRTLRVAVDLSDPVEDTVLSVVIIRERNIAGNTVQILNIKKGFNAGANTASTWAVIAILIDGRDRGDVASRGEGVQIRGVPVLALEFSHGHGGFGVDWGALSELVLLPNDLRGNSGRARGSVAVCRPTWSSTGVFSDDTRRAPAGIVQQASDDGNSSNEVMGQIVIRISSNDDLRIETGVAKLLGDADEVGVQHLLDGTDRSLDDNGVLVDTKNAGDTERGNIRKNAIDGSLRSGEELSDLSIGQIFAIVGMFGIGNLPENAIELAHLGSIMIQGKHDLVFLSGGRSANHIPVPCNIMNFKARLHLNP